MKSIFNLGRIAAPLAALALGLPGLLGVAGCRASTRSLPAATPTDGGDAQRLVMLVDYVGGDYRRAVVDGKIALPEEYEEQVRFVVDARSVAVRLGAREGDALLAGIDRLGALVGEHADADRVAAAAHEAREQAVARFHLATIPQARPSLERAQATYTRTCAVCHGEKGDGNTETARRLDPAPAQFSDPARLREMSPFRVYNALTFGVKGTAMPSFEALSAGERWDLAFFVFRLGHEGQRADPAPPLAIAQLATRSNRELVALLRDEGVARPEGALVQLRRQAPFEEPPADAGVERTRQMLARARATFAKGQAAEADRQALDAYLLGFEPLEPRLRARDAERTDAVERGFRDLRVAMSAGRSHDVDETAERLDALLVADGEGTTRPVVPLLASLLIFLREGIEAALLIGALLAGLRRMDRKDATRWVHFGWLSALPAGLLTWWLSEKALAKGAAQRELMEAVLALLAAAVLFSMSFWMISKAEARRWTGYLRRGLQEGLDRRNLGLLFGVAFLAVYREAAETVLFTQALLMEAGNAQRTQVWLGAGIGLLSVAAVAGVLSRTVDRLPVATFFGVSSLLLCGLAIAFAGSGIYELVAAGYLHPRPVAFPEIPWMGIHPDLTALLVQLTIVTIIAVAALSTFTRRPQGASTVTRPE